MLKVRNIMAACLRPSAVMLATAGVIVAAFLVWLVLLTPKTMHSALEAYPGFDKLGDRTFLFHRLTQLREKPPGNELRIAIIGASTTRESIWTPESFAERVSAGVDRPVSAVELTSGGQRLLVSWSLVEQTVCGGFDIAVVAVNMGLFTKEQLRNPARYIGYRAPTVDAYFGEQPIASGSFLFDNTRFVAGTLYHAAHTPLYNLTGDGRLISRKDAHRGQRFVGKMNAHKRHRFVGKPEKSPHRVLTKLRKTSHIYGSTYHKYAANNFAILEGMVKMAKECEGEVILIDTPRHSWLLEKSEFKSYQAAFYEHEAALIAFAKKHGLAFIDPNQLVAYTPDDANDHGHLRLEATIRATTDAIADAVADHILRKENDGEVSALQ